MKSDSMKDKDVDKYLSEHLSGSEPGEAFKQDVLRDSMAAFTGIQRRRLAWRRAELTAAAVLIAGVAFLGGRLSVPRKLPGSVDVAPRAVAETDGVTVPNDLIVWMDAARLFKRFGMEERMVRAYERASKLTPYKTTVPISTTVQALATDGGDEVFENQNKDSILEVILGPHDSVGRISGIMAQSFGDYCYENQMD